MYTELVRSGFIRFLNFRSGTEEEYTELEQLLQDWICYEESVPKPVTDRVKKQTAEATRLKAATDHSSELT